MAKNYDRLYQVLSWLGLSSLATSSAAGGAFAAVSDDKVAANPLPTLDPLVLSLPHSNSSLERFAAHGSHASHASHSSHYSGSGSSYTPPPTTYVAPAVPAVPPAARKVPTVQEKLVMVMRAQAKLFQLGFFKGNIDGTLAPTTEDALRRYQLVQGIPPTGKLDDLTLLKLGITY